MFLQRCSIVFALVLLVFGSSARTLNSDSSTVSGPADFSDIFARIAEKVNPSVVNITCSETQTQTADTKDSEQDKGADEDTRYGIGSGVIIDPQGYILTNNHVVEEASKIEVKLSNNQEFVARLIGGDRETDLALIKVDPKEPLPVARMGDSDQLKPGQWVMAIGNPFVYDHTVTVGVISALNRRLGATIFDNFIQTDAAINFGNSGGPLLNLKGEVIGINTLISSQGTGIGFSIPINMVKEILPQLKAKGKVSRGFLGLVPQDITPELQKSMGLADTKGIIVSSVQKGSPADLSGLKRYDVVLEVDGKKVDSEDQFRRLIAEAGPGKKVVMKVQRESEIITIAAQLTERDTSVPATEPPATDPKNPNKIGLQVVDLSAEARLQYGIPQELGGVLVTAVKPGEAADLASLRKGDVIVELNRQAIANASAFEKKVVSTKAGDMLLLYVFHDGLYRIAAMPVQ